MNHLLFQTDPMFKQISFLIMIFLFVLSGLIFGVRHKSTYFSAGWASIKSWLFLAPFILLILSLPAPWPLFFLTMTGIFSAKRFFQMVGIYHRSWFIWATYLSIMSLGYLVFKNNLALYNLMPMIFLGIITLIPLIKNSPTNMIQYIALSLLSFIFWGWCLLHFGLLLNLDQGVFIVLYLILLTEVSDNISNSVGRIFGRIKPFDKITSRVTLEGVLISVLVALFLAWNLHYLLPNPSGEFWISAGLVSALSGRIGGLILTGIRRDLGIKNTGIFIIGRGDILSRTDKLMFVGPLYFYIYLFLQQKFLPL
ncbi:MAG: phosphatidate cytidylyltransferase [Bdellovibrionales bacterium]|nr:phosphatidate cytidylyltransferase [Bdellovibrionales bacterium]